MFKIYKIAPKTWSLGTGDIECPLPEKAVVFDDEFDAQDMADFLNRVFEAGQKSVQGPIRIALGL